MEVSFKKLELSSRDTFDRYLHFYQPKAGELTFANLHMWDCVYNSYFTEFEGFLCIVCGNEDSKFALMPIDGVGGDRIARLSRTLEMLEAELSKLGQRLELRRITEDETIELEKAAACLQRELEIEFDRDNSDYVYNYDEISQLHGKKYHAKRNHIQNLLNNENPEYFKLTEEHMKDCVTILEHWHADKQDDEEMQCEKKSQMVLIENFKTYGNCRGALVKVNGISKAYTIGQLLNETTLVVHSERADPTIRGLYPYLNQQHLLREWPEVEFVNREQDCGSEGLRKAKLSYHPSHLENKYKVSVLP